MAVAKLYNLARVTTATTGTGTMTLGSAAQNCLTFAQAGVQNGDTVAYAISDVAATEEGIGVYSSTGPTLTRTVRKSSNSNAAINLSGNAQVFITPSSLEFQHLGVPGGSRLYNLSLAVSAASGALTIAIKDSDGNDPTADWPAVVDFRNNTATAGTVAQVLTTAATSLVIPSGATLGFPSSAGCRAWVLQFSDGQIGVTNRTTAATGTKPLVEGIASSTAISSSASTVGVIYTTSAVTSKAYRILGYIEWGASGMTAGTWTTTNLAEIRLFGPGVKKPGDVVQFGYKVDSGSASTTSASTWQDTTLLAPIIPTSAANGIAALAVGQTYTASSSVYAKSKLWRSTTIDFGNLAQGALGASELPVTMSGFDMPNTTASTNYLVRFLSGNAGSTAYWDVNLLPTTLTLMEIMG